MANRAFDTLWINATLATCDAAMGLINHGALASRDNAIAWCGSMRDLPSGALQQARQVIDVEGRCITPGLIDCHTHLVYAKNRALEFAKRLQGLSYQEIAAQGGGIMTTVHATRQAPEQTLFDESLKRAKKLVQNGVRVLEIKSGYGLDLATESKMLRVAKRIGESLSIPVYTTFLGAHSIAPEFNGDADAFVDELCHYMIPAIAEQQLATAVDVFCERIAFNVAQTAKIFQAAKAHGLAIKCHAEQLSNIGASQCAAKFNAVSVDHGEYLDEISIQQLAASGTVVVLLPGAYYFLGETQRPPIELLRRYQIPIAVATDCNPGTSPTTSIPLMMSMACVLFGLTPEEALLGVTQHAALALDMDKTHGSLTVGKSADVVVWDIEHPRELCYYF